MLVKLVLGIFLPCLLAQAQPIVGADAEKYCPKLPEGSAFHWSYDKNSGFCLAHRGDPLTDTTGTIGVSSGNGEGFSPKLLKPLRKTKLNGISVSWYKMQVKGVSIGLQALLDTPNGSPSHVWVLADDSSTVSQLLSVASEIDFERVRP